MQPAQIVFSEVVSYDGLIIEYGSGHFSPMKAGNMSIRASVDLKLDPSSAFGEIVDELATALDRLGIDFGAKADGLVTEGLAGVGKVVRWQPPEEILIEWRPAAWQPEVVTSLGLRFEAIADGTRVTLEQSGWETLLGDSGNELAGWFASELAAPLFSAMGPSCLGDWITDRRARRPSGPQARAIYRDPIYHRPNFKAILAVLGLRSGDYLLEVGCGGGAFLHDALSTGCRAAAIDHSLDMVKLAREVNREAIQKNRLEIREGEAVYLPYSDGTFTCAVMTGVFGFIEDPLRALSEVHRVLEPGGRFVLFTGTKKLLGTPAAPEPLASRLHFYEDVELIVLAREAGFTEAHLEYPDFEPLAREAGVPEEHLGLFKDPGGGQLLIAKKG